MTTTPKPDVRRDLGKGQTGRWAGMLVALGRGRRRKGARVESYRWLFLPWLLISLVIVALPFLQLVRESFWTARPPLRPAHDFSTKSYETLVHSDAYRTVITHTLGTMLAVMGLLILIGLPAAYGLADRRLKPHTKTIIMLLLSLPFFAGPMVRVLGLQGLLGVKGAINTGLLQLHLVETPLTWLLQSNFATILGLIYNNLGLIVFPAWLAFEAIPDAEYNSARDLHATRSTVFWRIAFPRAFPGIGAGLVLALVSINAAFLEPQLLGGASGDFLTNVIASQVLTTLNWPLGAALAVVLMAGTLVTCLALLAVCRLCVIRLSHWRHASVLASFSLVQRFSLARVLLWAALVFIVAPMALIALFSLNRSPYYGFPLNLFTFDWYVTLFDARPLIESLQGTVALAVVSAVLACAIATPAAYGLARLSGRARMRAFMLVSWPILVPTLILAVGLQQTVVSTGLLTLGFTATVVGYIAYLVPFVILIEYAHFANIDWSVQTAARDLGAGAFRRFVSVMLPLGWVGVRSGLLIAFVLVVNEYNLGLFLGRGINSLAVYVAALAGYGIRPDVLALATMINTLVMIIIAFVVVRARPTRVVTNASAS